MSLKASMISAVVLITLLAVTGCGGDNGGSDRGGTGEGTAAETRDATTTSNGKSAAADSPALKGTKVVLGDSEFGRMLFNSKKQAIYIFERDEKDKSNCYGECAAAWPPVLTEGRPQAGEGVKSSLLDTTKRRDGKSQVTYAGKPLYYYVNEGPGEVKCHNVNLNGGFWWAVGADGERLQ
jgi:predicted lipoprotein with Yx(FWY)xxD motif